MRLAGRRWRSSGVRNRAEPTLADLREGCEPFMAFGLYGALHVVFLACANALQGVDEACLELSCPVLRRLQPALEARSNATASSGNPVAG